MADNPYSSQSIVNYNSSAPPDDGSQVSANEITWAGIKAKLADPIKSLAEGINTAVLAAFASTINIASGQSNTIAATNTWSGTNTFSGTVAVTGPLVTTPTELTIASGNITPSRAHHSVDTESDASSDDLDGMTTTSTSDDAIVILRAAHTDRTVVIQHEAGNSGNRKQFHLSNDQDFSLDSTEKFIAFYRDATSDEWYEMFRSHTSSLSLGTEQTPSGVTTVDFTGLPTGVKRIKIGCEGLSKSGTDGLLVQLGDTDGIETSGYVSTGLGSDNTGNAVSNSTAGFYMHSVAAADVFSGIITLVLTDAANFTWVCEHNGKCTTTFVVHGGGHKSLSAELTQVRMTVTGTNTFDAGSINIQYD